MTSSRDILCSDLDKGLTREGSAMVIGPKLFWTLAVTCCCHWLQTAVVIRRNLLWSLAAVCCGHWSQPAVVIGCYMLWSLAATCCGQWLQPAVVIGCNLLWSLAVTSVTLLHAVQQSRSSTNCAHMGFVGARYIMGFGSVLVQSCGTWLIALQINQSLVCAYRK